PPPPFPTRRSSDLDSQGCLTATEAKPFCVGAPPSGRNPPNNNNETPETKKPADWRVFPSSADQLLDLGFLVDHVLAHDRIVLLDLDLVGRGALVLVGGVEVAGTGAGHQTDQVTHDSSP